MPKGGKREGAGNKPKVPGQPNEKHVGTRISQQLFDRLTKVRGAKNQSDAIREAIERWVKEQESA